MRFALAITGLSWVLLVVGCQPTSTLLLPPRSANVEWVDDGTPAYAKPGKRPEDVKLLDVTPGGSYRKLGSFAYQSVAGADSEVLAKLRIEGARHGCYAVLLPREDAKGIDCIVIDEETP